ERFSRQFRADLWVVPATGGRARRLTRGRGNAIQPAWSPDGSLVAFLGDENGSEGTARHSHAMVVPADGGATPRSLSETLDLNAGGFGGLYGCALQWHPEGDLLFLVVDGGTTWLAAAPLAGGVLQVKGGDRSIEAFDVSADGSRVAMVSGWADDPL